jgi:hypothetical protein
LGLPTPSGVLLVVAEHFVYELLPAIGVRPLLQLVLLGDGEVEGGWVVVAVAGGLADFLAGALAFEVGDQLVGCGILCMGSQAAHCEGEDCEEVFFHGCGCVYEFAGENCGVWRDLCVCTQVCALARLVLGRFFCCQVGHDASGSCAGKGAQGFAELFIGEDVFRDLFGHLLDGNADGSGEGASCDVFDDAIQVGFIHGEVIWRNLCFGATLRLRAGVRAVHVGESLQGLFGATYALLRVSGACAHLWI